MENAIISMDGFELGTRIEPEHTDPMYIGEMVLGSFRIVSELGSGSYATAYVARQEGTDRKAVVKIAHPHLMRSKHEEVIAERFAAEFKAATRVQHPNLVTVFTAGKTNAGLPAIAMEHIEGKLLHDMLRKHAPLEPDYALRLIQPLISALDALHRAQVIHRDITPTNIMVTRHPATRKAQLKLLDFGIAKLDDGDGRTMGPIGTPRYLAPEQFFGQAHINSDIYSLGAILWWMLTGEEHMEQAISEGDSLMTMMQRPNVCDPRKLKPNLASEAAEICRDMLSYEPHDRPDAEVLFEIIGKVRRSLRKRRKQDTVEMVPFNPISLDKSDAPNTHPSLTPEMSPSTNPGLSRTLSSWKRSYRQKAISRFIGNMPEWLALLDEAADNGELAAISKHVESIAFASKAMGADHMARLANMIEQFSHEGLLSEAKALIGELNTEYVTTFREMMSAMHAP